MEVEAGKEWHKNVMEILEVASKQAGPKEVN
jgi:hypothetical protein